jgi:hypothetical protein
MQVRVDENRFDELQNFLADEIVAATFGGLEPLGLPRTQLQEVITSIAFNVCCAVDGSTIMHLNGERVFPVLTFAATSEFNELLSTGSTSFMHEYIHGIVEQFLAKKL